MPKKPSTKSQKNKQLSNNPITEKILYQTLADFTEQNLLPAVESIVDDKLDKRLAEFRQEERNYYDQKFIEVRSEMSDIKKELKETRSDIIATIEGEKERDTKFKNTLIKILKRNDLLQPDELKFLSALAK